MIEKLMTYVDCRELGLTAYLDTKTGNIIMSEGIISNCPYLARIPTKEEKSRCTCAWSIWLRCFYE